MEFKDIFVFILIVGLIIVCTISFSTLFSSQNDAQVNINQNLAIERLIGNVSTELNQSSSRANETMQGLVEEEKSPIITTIGFAFTSILSALNVFGSMGINTLTYLFTFAQEFFLINPIVTGTIMAILLGVLVLAIWSVIRAGR